MSSYDWLGSLIFSPLGFILLGTLADGGRAAPTLVVIALLDLDIHVLLACLPAIRRPVAPLDPVGEAAPVATKSGS